MRHKNPNGLVILTLVSILFNQYTTLRFQITKPDSFCLLDEFQSNTFPLIYYKVYGLDKYLKGPHIDSILRSISIVVIDDQDRRHAHSEVIKSLNDKFSVKITKDSIYRICVNLIGGYWAHQVNLEMQLKISHIAKPKPNILDVLNKDNIGELHDKINDLILKGQTIVESKSLELDLEEQEAKSIVDNQTNLVYFALIQVGMILILLVYQIVSLLKVLHSDKTSFGYHAHSYI